MLAAKTASAPPSRTPADKCDKLPTPPEAITGTSTALDIALTRTISDAVDVPVIASGGGGNLAHLSAGVLEGGADAVLAASIFHFGDYTVSEAKQSMQENGIEVRL